MKINKKYFILIILLFPLVANANIMCNDGTESYSCVDCHRGCCSSHGGCAKDDNGNDIEYEEIESNIEDEEASTKDVVDDYIDEYGYEDDEEETNSDDNTVNYIGYVVSGALGYLAKAFKDELNK